MKKILLIFQRLKHPRVRKRLKIALSVYAIGFLLAIAFKVVYDIGFFNARALDDEKMAKLRSSISREKAVLTIESAQRIVSGALKENPRDPKTVVTRIIGHDPKLSSIVIENNQQQRVAWIIDMRLFFVGDLLDAAGYNLTESAARRHNVNNAGY